MPDRAAATDRLHEHLSTLALGGGHPLMVVVPRDALKALLRHARPVDIESARRRHGE